MRSWYQSLSPAHSDKYRYTARMRLDQFLTGMDGIKSRAVAQRLIDDGLVLVNGRKVTKASKDVSSSDKLEWIMPKGPEVPVGTVSSFDLPILYEDDECMVINKPAKLTVHPGNGTREDEETLLDALRPVFEKKGLPFSDAEVLVHRLDKDTTGCLLIAKNGKAHMALQKQFADRTVDKRYLTLVAGKPMPPSAVIDAPIGRNMNERTRMSVHQALSARAARTTYRTIASEDGATLLECELHTGRTHQIRVHLKTVGHPVVGDISYGTGASEVLAEKLGIHFLCLHAWKLSFTSPTTKKKVSVVCPLPETFGGLLKRMEIQVPKA